MSAAVSADHHHDRDDHHDDIGYHATVRGYVVGFLLSGVLGAIPFWPVMGKVAAPAATGFLVLGFAAVQMLVHMVYFLHLNAKVEGGWSMLALLFTAALVVVVLAGSVWVMYHLNPNMMPMAPHDMRSMP